MRRVDWVYLAALVMLGAGLLVWIWSGEWRWGVSALVLFVLTAAAGPK
jgi:hypothetical protein